MLLMSFINLTSDDKEQLLKTAAESINYGLQNHCALSPDLNNVNALLQNHGASFVSLHLNKQLRGCIGTLEAYQPLIRDIAEHAYDAAFNDPRFAAVNKQEISKLEISISILTPATAIDFVSEADLLSQLKPSIDGLILQAGNCKATFLPVVWQQLNTAQDFVEQLKLKAGLKKTDWPDDISVYRYHTISF